MKERLKGQLVKGGQEEGEWGLVGAAQCGEWNAKRWFHDS